MAGTPLWLPPQWGCQRTSRRCLWAACWGGEAAPWVSLSPAWSPLHSPWPSPFERLTRHLPVWPTLPPTPHIPTCSRWVRPCWSCLSSLTPLVGHFSFLDCTCYAWLQAATSPTQPTSPPPSRGPSRLLPARSGPFYICCPGCRPREGKACPAASGSSPGNLVKALLALLLFITQLLQQGSCYQRPGKSLKSHTTSREQLPSLEAALGPALAGGLYWKSKEDFLFPVL